MYDVRGSALQEPCNSLTVEDVNDSPPVFQDISSIRFSEDTNPGVPFSRVSENPILHP